MFSYFIGGTLRVPLHNMKRPNLYDENTCMMKKIMWEKLGFLLDLNDYRELTKKSNLLEDVVLEGTLCAGCRE